MSPLEKLVLIIFLCALFVVSIGSLAYTFSTAWVDSGTVTDVSKYFDVNAYWQYNATIATLTHGVLHLNANNTGHYNTADNPLRIIFTGQTVGVVAHPMIRGGYWYDVRVS